MRKLVSITELPLNCVDGTITGYPILCKGALRSIGKFSPKCQIRIFEPACGSLAVRVAFFPVGLETMNEPSELRPATRVIAVVVRATRWPLTCNRTATGSRASCVRDRQDDCAGDAQASVTGGVLHFNHLSEMA